MIKSDLVFITKIDKYQLQKLIFIQENFFIRNIFEKIKNKQTYKTGQSLKKNILRPSQVCISSGFLKFLSGYSKAFKVCRFI